MKKDTNTLYVVSGFMRTGTSMMMKALEAGGMKAQYKQSRDEMKNRFADEFYDPNIGGLYELEREDYQKPDFPKEYAGKMIKVLNQGVIKMAVMNEIRVVFMRRDDEEIRQSYEAFFGQELRINDSFQGKIDETIEKIRNRRDIKSIDVFWYRKVISKPFDYFQILQSHGWDIDIEKAVDVVNPECCRFKKELLIKGII